VDSEPSNRIIEKSGKILRNLEGKKEKGKNEDNDRQSNNKKKGIDMRRQKLCLVESGEDEEQRILLSTIDPLHTPFQSIFSPPVLMSRIVPLHELDEFCMLSFTSRPSAHTDRIPLTLGELRVRPHIPCRKSLEGTKKYHTIGAARLRVLYEWFEEEAGEGVAVELVELLQEKTIESDT
jgi:hypothetical protein